MKLTVVLCLCLLATYSCSSVSATGSNLQRRLEEEDKVEPFKELIGNIEMTLGVIDQGVNLFGKVMDLFGSETSETLEREFTERGYESFVAKTQVKKGTNVRMKDYRAEMESALQNMDIFKKMPKSYKRQVAATVSAFYQIPKEEGTWYDTDFVFKAGTKGKAHSIHIYFYRQANDFTRCDNFHYLIMGNTFDFKMADDIFVISKSKSSMGGRFKSTKLEWKKKDAAIKEADITFITATFQATALGVIESARLKNTELTCTTFKKPKKPWKPIKFDMMDDGATYDFGSEIGYEYQPAGRGVPLNPFNFDESDEDVDRCDAGYRPGRSAGNKKYEVNQNCYDKCYQVCNDRGGKVPGWRTQPCANNCEEQCNRCNKYVYNRLPKIRNCPVPECLIKNEAWDKCVNDVHSYVGGTGTRYFDRALKVLSRNGISTDKYQISYLYCRCATQGSTEEACQYFPPPIKKGSKLRGAEKREKRREEREKRRSARNPGNLKRPTKSYLFDEEEENVGDSYWTNRWLNNMDEAEENVGGGRVYGEYNKGPYKAGAEYNWDEAEENVGDSYWTNRWLNNMDEA